MKTTYRHSTVQYTVLRHIKVYFSVSELIVHELLNTLQILFYLIRKKNIKKAQDNLLADYLTNDILSIRSSVTNCVETYMETKCMQYDFRQ